MAPSREPTHDSHDSGDVPEKPDKPTQGQEPKKEPPKKESIFRKLLRKVLPKTARKGAAARKEPAPPPSPPSRPPVPSRASSPASSAPSPAAASPRSPAAPAASSPAATPPATHPRPAPAPVAPWPVVPLAVASQAAAPSAPVPLVAAEATAPALRVAKPSSPVQAPAGVPAGAPASGGWGRYRSFIDSHVVLLAVDPSHALALWEVDSLALEAARRRAGGEPMTAVLRFHEVSWIEFDGSNANETFDIPVSIEDGKHYVNLWAPGKNLLAQIGMKDAGGEFHVLARSNFLDLPPDTESPRADERRRTVLGDGNGFWKPRHTPAPSPEPDAAPGAFVAEAALSSSADEPGEMDGSGSETSTSWAPAREDVAAPEPASAVDEGLAVESGLEWAAPRGASPEPLSSWGPSDEGLSSGERPVEDVPLRVELRADIVVYGRARPGTVIVIDDTPVVARQDGTFDVRFALPRVPPPVIPRTAPPLKEPGESPALPPRKGSALDADPLKLR